MRECDSEGHLSEGHVCQDSQIEPSIRQLHIKVSKVDPFHKGVYVYLGRTGNELCPVVAVAGYLAVRGRQSGPFSCFVSGIPVSRERSIQKTV